MGNKIRALKQLRINYGSDDLEKAKNLFSRIVDYELLVLIGDVVFVAADEEKKCWRVCSFHHLMNICSDEAQLCLWYQ